MRRLRPSNEAEMVALFLRTELPAARFRDRLRALLDQAGQPERLVTAPSLDDPAENQAREQLLTQHREYGARTGLFDGFPHDLCLEWMAITPAGRGRLGWPVAAGSSQRCGRRPSGSGRWGPYAPAPEGKDVARSASRLPGSPGIRPEIAAAIACAGPRICSRRVSQRAPGARCSKAGPAGRGTAGAATAGR